MALIMKHNDGVVRKNVLDPWRQPLRLRDAQQQKVQNVAPHHVRTIKVEQKGNSTCGATLNSLQGTRSALSARSGRFKPRRGEAPGFAPYVAGHGLPRTSSPTSGGIGIGDQYGTLSNHRHTR